MKYSWLLIFCFLAFPVYAFAHGGVQKQAGNTTVYISQNPISPLVGEQVHITFVLKQGLNAPLRNMPVILTLIDTYYGDESRDKIILKKSETTDANGAFEFQYIFSKQNYFDVDVSFVDPTTKTRVSTGYLIQPREFGRALEDYVPPVAPTFYDQASNTVGPFLYVLFGVVLAFGVGKGFALYRRIFLEKSSKDSFIS